MTSSIHRFVPATNAVSLSSDAPGYVHNANANPDGGPTCYKCKGFGKMFYRNGQKLCDPRLLLVDGSVSVSVLSNKGKRKKKKDDVAVPVITEKKCKVCKGKGFLPRKKREIDCASLPGQITRGRKCPNGWSHSGPLPAAMSSYSSSSSGDADADADVDAADNNDTKTIYKSSDGKLWN